MTSTGEMSDEAGQNLAANVAGPTSRVIIQQCLSARLQVRAADGDTDAEFVQINRGAIIFICFLQGATSETVNKIAKTALNVRLSENDVGKLVSVLELPGDILIVPQATLGGRVKGRSMQYHGNVDKQTGLQLYEQFVSCCQEAVKQTTNPCAVHCGTYGNRQVLSSETNGPYSHIIEI